VYLKLQVSFVSRVFTISVSVMTNTVFTRIQDENFFPDLSPKKLGGGSSSYNRAQSSKNRANVFVISNTVNICLG
jgi:hypothetical protein